MDGFLPDALECTRGGVLGMIFKVENMLLLVELSLEGVVCDGLRACLRLVVKMGRSCFLGIPGHKDRGRTL